MWELWVSPWMLGLVGLLIGSFLNVVAHRLPSMYMRDWWAYDIGEFALNDPRSWRAAFGQTAQPPAELGVAAAAVRLKVEGLGPLSLLNPRSRCPHCGHQITAVENIPVLSWLVLRGRCSACKAPIAKRYPLVELATAALFAACAWRYGASGFTLVACVALALLVVMALVDLDYTLLPDSLTIPLVALGLMAAATGVSAISWVESATGALIGYGVLWGLATFWHVAFGKANAMAEGDMKMLAGIGALLGWKAVPAVLMMSAGIGAIVGVTLIATRALKRETPIPFGPYLALAGITGVLAPKWMNGFGDSLGLLLP